MDNLTHTLTGFALARAGLDRRTRGATLTLVLASNVPDVDLVFQLGGPASYLEHHRGITHSLVAAPLLAVTLAAAIRFGVREARMPWLVLAGLVGVLGHLLMDLWTNYGTRLLEPFRGTWYALDLVFIIDPLLLALLGGTLLLAAWSAQGPKIASMGLGLVLAYVCGRAVLHERALEAAREKVPAPLVQIAALPTPLNPFLWRILADTGEAYYTGEINLQGSTPPLRKREKLAPNAAIEQARASELASVFLDFARFPWVEVEDTPEGTAVKWTDLRFEWSGRESFVTRVVVGPDGRIRSEAFRF
jgi:inner membrane protein